ncbi:MAG: response regulator transcription factor [Roseiflexaceae bacterium]
MSPIRVLLVDDHLLVRAGINALLQKLPGIEVIGEADDGYEALRLVAQLRPDVVLLDISMPGLNGLETTTRIIKEFPDTAVIMLSMHSGEEYVIQALRAGASGYLLKGARIAELDLAVTSVARGETYLSPAASRHLVSEYREGRTATPAAAASVALPQDRLTPRQREVLQLLAEGHSAKEIAHALSLSVKTIEMHRAELMRRLGVHDLAGLVRYAIRTGIVSPND